MPRLSLKLDAHRYAADRRSFYSPKLESQDSNFQSPTFDKTHVKSPNSALKPSRSCPYPPQTPRDRAFRRAPEISRTCGPSRAARMSLKIPPMPRLYDRGG
jgi:hypothetical protein